MKSIPYLCPETPRIWGFFASLTCLGIGADVVFAQSSASSAADKEIVVELSPFIVDSTNDSGYVTNESLSGSRFSQNLNDIPSNISVMTAEMMKDLAAYDMQEAMDWSVNAVASGVGDSSSSEATGISDVERRNTTISIRGLDSSNARNFFKWSINSDSYNVDRIDSSRGPNALLFGASNLAGLNNITTKQALFRDSHTISYAYDSTGGPGRIALDVNRELIKDKFALRLNVFTQDIDQWHDFGNTQKEGLALAGTWKLPAGFTVRFEGETGNSDIISPKTAIRDSTNNWDHYTIAAATVGTNAQRNAANAAAGIAVEPATGAAVTLDVNRLQDGPVDWAGKIRTTGTNSFLKPFVDVGLTTGTQYTAAPLLAPAVRVNSAAEAYRSTMTTPDWDYGNLQMAGRVVGDYETYSLFLEKKFSNNFFMELGYNHQDEVRLWHAEDGNPNIIYYDLNQTLPAGYLIDGSNVNPNFLKPYITSTPGVREDYVESDEFRALAVYQYRGSWFRLTFGGNVSYRESRSGQYRRSLTITNGPIADLSNTANRPRFRYYLSDPAEAITKFTDGETYTLGGAKLEFINAGTGAGQAHTVDELTSAMLFTSGSWGNQGKLQTTMGIRRDKYNIRAYNTYVTDPITKVYLRSDLSDTDGDSIDSPSVGAVYHATDWLSFYGNYSKSFVFGDKRQLSFLDTTIPPPIGESTEYGIRFKVGQKISGSIGYYDSLQENNVVIDQNIINTVQNIYTELGLGTFGQHVDTNLQKGTGYEFQVAGNLTKSWTLVANVAFPKISTTDTFMYAYDDFFAKESPAWYAIANDASNPSSTLIQGYLDSLVARRATKNVQDGLGSLKLIKMTGSILSKYTFRDGKLKGLSVGGGAKYRGENNIARNASAEDIWVDPYFEYTMFGRYAFKWKELAWNVSLNVTNPFNQLNFRYTTINATTLDGQTFRISTPRTVRLGVEVSF